MIPCTPGSFGGVTNLSCYALLTCTKVEHYLSKLNAYTLHKHQRRQRCRTFSKGIDDLYQVNLVHLSDISCYNDLYHYLLTCIVMFSKEAFVELLLTKSIPHVTKALQRILANGGSCRMLQMDKAWNY